jgi:hypothetical protein
MNNLSKYNEPNGGNLTYRDLSKMEVFEKWKKFYLYALIQMMKHTD